MVFVAAGFPNVHAWGLEINEAWVVKFGVHASPSETPVWRYKSTGVWKAESGGFSTVGTGADFAAWMALKTCAFVAAMVPVAPTLVMANMEKDVKMAALPILQETLRIFTVPLSSQVSMLHSVILVNTESSTAVEYSRVEQGQKRCARALASGRLRGSTTLGRSR